MGTANLHIRLRPIKLAFIVPANDTTALVSAIEVNSSLWGGMYNPILPNYERLPTSWFQGPRLNENARGVLAGYIDTFDPDFVVIPDGLTQLNFPIGHRRTVKQKEILEGATRSGVPKYGVGLFEVLQYYIRKEARFVTHDKLQIWTFQDEASRDPFLSAVFGALPSALNQIFINQFAPRLQSKTASCSFENYASFLETNNLFVRRFTGFNIKSSGQPANAPDCIFYMDAKSNHDIIDYWNLRATGRSVVPVPKQAVKSESVQRMVRDVIEDNYHPSDQSPWFANVAEILRSRSISPAEFAEFQTQLESQIPPTGEHHKYVLGNYPRIWEPIFRGREYSNCCDFESRSKSRQLDGDLTRITSKTLAPKFIRKTSTGAPRFANDVDLRVYGNEELTAEVLPEGGSEIARAFNIFGSFNWRVSKKGLVYYPEHPDVELSLSSGNSESVFGAWLQTQGWSTTPSQAGRTARQLLKQVGGLWGIQTLANEGLIRLLGDMNESKGIAGELFTLLRRSRTGTKATEQNLIERIETLFGTSDERGVFSRDRLGPRLNEIAKDSKIPTNSNAILKSLIEKQALRIGLTIDCPVCNRPSWYPIDALDYRLRCQKCAEEFALPSEDPRKLRWAYKTFGAFSLPGQADGAYAVLLTLRFFSRVLDAATTPILNVIARKDRAEVEADLALLLRESRFFSMRSETVFCECKTFDRFERKDVQRLSSIAGHFPTAILVFATLRRSLEQPEKRMIASLVSRSRKNAGNGRPYNPILILTGNELFAEWRVTTTWNAMGGQHAIWANRLFGPDTVRSLCDATQELYLEIEPLHKWLKQHWESKAARSARPFIPV